jgi:hypothetical protein
MLGTVHVNLSYFGSAAIEKEKISMPDLNSYLQFCDYLPLDENLTFQLDNFLFSSPKDDLYHV